jgi:hypothetical protein
MLQNFSENNERLDLGNFTFLPYVQISSLTESDDFLERYDVLDNKTMIMKGEKLQNYIQIVLNGQKIVNGTSTF